MNLTGVQFSLVQFSSVHAWVKFRVAMSTLGGRCGRGASVVQFVAPLWPAGNARFPTPVRYRAVRCRKTVRWRDRTTTRSSYRAPLLYIAALSVLERNRSCTVIDVRTHCLSSSGRCAPGKDNAFASSPGLFVCPLLGIRNESAPNKWHNKIAFS